MDNSTSDGERIAELYREMYGQMFAYASCILRDRDLAEEAVQDAFCILCVKAEDTFTRDNPKGWLMRVLQNVMRNRSRQRAAVSRLIMRSVQAEHLDALLVYDEEDVDVLYGDLAAHADFQLLKRVVLDDCTMLEAAEETGITVEACKKRVQRVKKLLRKKLAGP